MNMIVKKNVLRIGLSQAECADQAERCLGPGGGV